jgi:hypothetical protein
VERVPVFFTTNRKAVWLHIRGASVPRRHEVGTAQGTVLAAPANRLLGKGAHVGGRGARSHAVERRLRSGPAPLALCAGARGLIGRPCSDHLPVAAALDTLRRQKRSILVARDLANGRLHRYFDNSIVGDKEPENEIAWS